MCAKGRVKWTTTQLLSLLKQVCERPLDERSEPGKPQVLRVSARSLRNHGIRCAVIITKEAAEGRKRREYDFANGAERRDGLAAER